MMLVSVTLEEERISDRPLPPTLSNMDWMPFFSASCSQPITQSHKFQKKKVRHPISRGRCFQAPTLGPLPSLPVHLRHATSALLAFTETRGHVP